MIQDVEVVLFDMGGTLRGTQKRSREERLRYTAEILDLLGSGEDPSRFSRRLARRATAYRQWARETLKELSEVELWKRWMLPDWPGDFIQENAAMLNFLWREATGVRTVFPETSEVIHELFRRGYRIGLVSNTTSSTETADALAKAGLTGYFETLILSAVVGIRKPDPAILLEATHRMKVEPSRCVYVGDLPHRDVISARRAGISATILIRQHGRHSPSQPDDDLLKPDYEIKNLRELLAILPIRVPPQPGKVYAAAVSTMWAIKRFGLFTDFLETARRLGFTEIELNHQVDSPILSGVQPGRYRFGSIHEPCPADVSATELKKRDLLISSTVENRRIEGVRSIQRSIDLAKKYGARVIVIHAGMVHTDRTLEDRLRYLYESGQTQNEEYHQLKQAFIQIRQERAPGCLNAVKKSLSELLAYTAGTGICLGIENRFHYDEIPSPDELDELLGLADPLRLGFIYDVGHAQVLSRLGFYPHDEWLRRFSRRMVAVHLHDVKGLNDHRIPGQGDVDFDLLAGYLPKGVLRTLEFQDFHTQEQVRAGLEFLQQHGCIEEIKD